MTNIDFLMPGEVPAKVAGSFKRLRLDKGHSRAKASLLTGVPEPTIRKFETTGHISFRQLVMLSHVYGDLNALLALFPETSPQTMNDLLSRREGVHRQRGRS